MLLYAVTIFLSAFLLFQVQPIIARMILPWFGGSSAVWSTCMLFFQVVLLLGYAYAHWLHERTRGSRQALAHTLILAASLAVLPILPDAAWKPAGPGNPSLRILCLLSVTIGLPYFLLSTTSPLIQAWYARTHRRGLPYRLYALSNLASMLALLSYPPLVEPNLSTVSQARIWSAAYAMFVVLCAATAWHVARRSANGGHPESGYKEVAAVAKPGAGVSLLWMALAACASILLLAVTTFLTQDVAPVPFLWILPLSAYLLSFILCFEAPRLYTRALWLPLLVPALGSMAYLSWPRGEKLHIVPTIGVFLGSLFVCCVVCHGELARGKPHPRHLTRFYLMVSCGGALGGLFVGLVAPNLFNAYYEFPIGLGLCAALATAILFLQPAPFLEKTGRLGHVSLAGALALYLAFLGIVVRDNVHGFRTVARNFYGQLRVEDQGEDGDEMACRKLLHGVINHGQQMRYEPFRRQPVSYFCKSSGIGRAMEALPEGVPRRVGVLGLGCGTLAAYGRAGDTFRFYEINPLVPQLARTEFSYLHDTPARTEVVLGDGRLALERESGQQFDLLVMDAFSGDSVPVHLITREAFATYFRHMKPSGILALNISNQYLDLRPVMERAAAAFGKIALLYEFTPENEDYLCFACSWVLVMNPAAYPHLPPSIQKGTRLHAQLNFHIWTDDYSNLYRILK